MSYAQRNDGGSPVAPSGRTERWLVRVLVRRLLPILTVTQFVAAAMIAGRGFPYFGSDLVSNAALWESPVALFHLPAIAALTASGHCCGFRNGRILGPRITAGHIRVRWDGLLILSLTNWSVWIVGGAVMLLAGERAARRRRRGITLPELPPPGDQPGAAV